ncbi:hypothetical protein SAMN05443572_11570 [Myxococcus fulvus]|uniref:Uncharacterized protein n=2 Tax=Myxococcus fulvus TaxID=33 RepID=A0A511TEU6_MYXFU|nr:hypothetical protein MFU01_67450 [Myxococcus fulvus]SEU40293.1 hypothetical protein SAMN05443572_11570 [Myxococcus fulvus]
MANHFACIGIHANDRKAFARVMDSLLEKTTSAGTTREHELKMWSDASGASYSFVFTHAGKVECAIPSFRAESRLRVRATGFAADESCRFCDPLEAEVMDAEGNVLYPFATQLDDIALVRERIQTGAELRLAPCAFAESLESWPDEAAYEASRKPGKALLGSRFFVPNPAALLARPQDTPPPPAEPRAHFTGHVKSADVLTNSVTGHSFQHALVQTYGGTFDVLAAVDEATPLLRPGNIVRGTFWLVARVTAGLG